MNEFQFRYAAFPETDENSWWTRLRYWRDEELAKTDWAMLPDAPTDKAVWETYRQELRDLPANTKDPKNPIIPVKPNA
jgi:hypothetical protein